MVASLLYGMSQLISADREDMEEVYLWLVALDIKVPQRKLRKKLKRKRPLASVYDTVSSAANSA